MSTYYEEMKQKYPNRPFIGRPTYELQNMVKALSFHQWLNGEEEIQRLHDARKELSRRRSRENK